MDTPPPDLGAPTGDLTGSTGEDGGVVDTRPPTFAGAVGAASSPNAVTISRAPASDDTTGPGDITYLIYEARASGAQSFAAPSHTTAPGATSFTAPRLATSTRYYYVVRARDRAGNVDGNLGEVTATTPAQGDSQTPTFAGLVSASGAGTAVTLSWLQATDRVTRSVDLVYLIYEARSPGAQDFNKPTCRTPAGVTQHRISGLQGGVTYHYVVWAQDWAGNIDANTVEKSATTTVPSLAGQVQPILTRECAGAGCHGGMSPAEGLELTAGKTYAALVGVASRQCPGTRRVAAGSPTTSYFMWKLQGSGPCLQGTRMPKGAPLSAADIDLVSSWIAGGAPNN